MDNGRENLISMNNYALKNLATKFFAVIFLCIGVLLLSAFTSLTRVKYLTRIDMAILLEKVLDDSSIGMGNNPLPKYSDLTKQQHESVEKVLRYRIMNGYTDNTFRPNEVMHNLEVISYLHRLSGFLRSKNPNCYAAKQLFRILSYSQEPNIAFEYSPINFSNEFEQSNKLTEKKLANELAYILADQNTNTSHILSGKIINSITNKPITSAFVSANNQAIAVDKNGCFSFKLPKKEKSAVIFAAADGYQPIEIRKDLYLSRNMTIRLRPVLD